MKVEMAQMTYKVKKTKYVVLTVRMALASIIMKDRVAR